MQEQKDHCKFSASLVNRARLSLKRNKAHRYVKVLGRKWRVHNIWASRYHVWCYKKILSIPNDSSNFHFIPKCAILSYLQNTVLIYSKCLFFIEWTKYFLSGTVYIQIHLIYDFAFVFNLDFFQTIFTLQPSNPLPYPSKYWNYRHDTVPSSQIHLSVNTILYIIKPFLKTTFLSVNISKQP